MKSPHRVITEMEGGAHVSRIQTDHDRGPKPGFYLSGWCALPRLEAEAGLQFDYPAGQGGKALAEGAVRRSDGLRAGDLVYVDGADRLLAVGEGREVGLVENVVEIGAQVDFGVFTQYRETRQAERFA